MQNKNSKAFTLVELIVVIVILAILWTIAFISLQWYSATARDSRRISDINNIKTSLELFQINTWEYPIPDEWEPVTYWWDVLRTQWIIWDNVTKNLSKNLNKKLLDPLLEIPYIYSTTSTKKEYQILVLYEKNLTREDKIEWITKVNAKYNLTPKLLWTYNELYVKSQHYIIPTPSIINAEITWSWLELWEETIKSQMITSWENMLDINSQVITNTWKLDINFSYTWTITKDSTISQKLAVINTIQSAYSWTSLSNDWIYKYVLNQSSNIDKINFIEKTVLTNNWKINIEITNWLCWEDNEKDLSSSPTNLCSKWIATTVVDKWVWDNYEWICQTPDFWEDVNCRANHVLVVNWECWSDNWTFIENIPTNLCNNWTSSSVIDWWIWNQYSWNCNWTNWWTNATCNANHIVIINWECWSDNWLNLISTPTNLCTNWTATPVTDLWTRSNYTWTCNWSYWTNANCIAWHVIKIDWLSLWFSHTCAKTTTWVLKCWWNNENYQVWDWSNINRNLPVYISDSVSKLVCNEFVHWSSCLITTWWVLKCWWNNWNYQLWDWTYTTRTTPTQIATWVSNVDLWTLHWCLITWWVLKCWWYNYYGQLWTTNYTDKTTPTTIMSWTSFSSISAWSNHTCWITTGWALYCWWNNANWELWNNSTTKTNTPTLILSWTSFSSVSAWYYHTCWIATNWDLYCWWNNDNWQLWDWTNTRQLVPKKILTWTSFLNVSTWTSHTCAVTTWWILKCWWSYTLWDSLVPIDISTWVSIVKAWGWYSCFINNELMLKCFWWNQYWELWDWTNTPRYSPVNVHF